MKDCFIFHPRMKDCFIFHPRMEDCFIFHPRMKDETRPRGPLGSRRQTFLTTVKHTVTHFHCVFVSSDSHLKAMQFCSVCSIYSVLLSHCCFLVPEALHESSLPAALCLHPLTEEQFPKGRESSRDPFYVVALPPHHGPGKVDPRRWHCKQSHHNAAAGRERRGE
jgi:hypothetical protein